MKKLLRILVIVMIGWAGHAQAQPKSSPGANSFESVFTLPATAKDGHDPFYPDSTRTMETKVATNNVNVFALTLLKFMGVSGTPGHLFAILNNHTFTVGDDGDVMTSSGRVHLRCVEITTGSVMVEINGQLHRIKLEAQ